MRSLRDDVEEAARRTGFSGAVRVDRSGDTVLCAAFGLADRAHGVPTTVETLFATASATKGFTALTVMSLVEDGILELGTTARSLLGDDLPLVGDDVTVEHLLAHTSGIGDYLDEDAIDDINDYVMPVPVLALATTEQWVPVLDGHPTVSPAGERFAYNNGGYVVLALLSERSAGTSFHELVRARVCEPAGMGDTGFLRSDELPGRAARGYLDRDGLRSNLLHLPVVGSGDGGIYSTVDDFHVFWESFLAGRVVSPAAVTEMLRPRTNWPEEGRRYGLGFHLAANGDAVFLEGHDAGVSIFSRHDPSTEVTFTVVSNWTDGAWALVSLLLERHAG